MSDPVTHDGRELLAITLVTSRNPAHLPPRSALKSLGAASQALVDAQITTLLVTRAQPHLYQIP